MISDDLYRRMNEQFLSGASDRARLSEGLRIVAEAGYDVDEVLRHAFPEASVWAAAALNGGEVVHTLQGTFKSAQGAVEAAAHQVTKLGLVATHVRASDGRQNVLRGL